MFCSVLLVLLAVCSAGAMSDTQLTSLKEVMESLEELGVKLNKTQYLLEDQQEKLNKTQYLLEDQQEELIKSKELLEDQQEELIKSKELLEYLIDGGGEEEEFTLVNVKSSLLSSATAAYPDRTADKATDGDINTTAITSYEYEPYYSAELGVRFTAIKLNISEYTFGADIVYIVDNGVETECARRFEPSTTKSLTWEVLCQNAGTGFKISAVPVYAFNRATVTYLELAEVTVEVKRA